MSAEEISWDKSTNQPTNHSTTLLSYKSSLAQPTDLFFFTSKKLTSLLFCKMITLSASSVTLTLPYMLEMSNVGSLSFLGCTTSDTCTLPSVANDLIWEIAWS